MTRSANSGLRARTTLGFYFSCSGTNLVHLPLIVLPAALILFAYCKQSLLSAAGRQNRYVPYGWRCRGLRRPFIAAITRDSPASPDPRVCTPTQLLCSFLRCLLTFCLTLIVNPPPRISLRFLLPRSSTLLLLYSSRAGHIS